MTNQTRTERLTKTAENAKGSSIYWLILLISIFTSFADEIGEMFHFLGRRRRREERRPAEGEEDEKRREVTTGAIREGINPFWWALLAAILILIAFVLWRPQDTLKAGIVMLAIVIRIVKNLYKSFNKSPKERAQRRAKALEAAGFNIRHPEGYQQALQVGRGGLDSLAKPHIDDAFDNLLLEEQEE